VILVLSRRDVRDPVPADPTRSFDMLGAILSAVGLVLIVMGILAADNNVWLTIGLIVAGALVLVWFFLSVRAKERSGREPLLSTALFRNSTSNLGLVTQNIQWLVLMGMSFVVSAFLQVVKGYSPIETGLILTSATVGLLLSSLSAERLAKRRAQRTLIMAGFIATSAGIVLLITLASLGSRVWSYVPGLFLIGLGIGLMLTPSVNVVQSAFPEEQQGEISGLSRSVSNLGSSLGTAIAGTILVAGITKIPDRSYALALIVLAAIGLIGLAAAAFLPRNRSSAAPVSPAGRTAPAQQ
jgi:predicted MFS family arabinose efflux permease